MAFQTVLMGHEPLRGMRFAFPLNILRYEIIIETDTSARITSVILDPVSGDTEEYKELNDPKAWPRCQIWKSFNIEEVGPILELWVRG